MKRKFVIIPIIMMIISIFNFTFGYSSVNADEIVTNEKVIDFVIMCDIMPVTDKGFMPDLLLTRAELVTVANRILHCDERDIKAVAGTTIFDDVPSNHWASGYVNMAVTTGLTPKVKTTTNLLNPNDNATIEDVYYSAAKALGYRYKNDTAGSYDTFSDIIDFAYDNGLNKGITKELNEEATKIDVARIIYNTLNTYYWEKNESGEFVKCDTTLYDDLFVNFINGLTLVDFDYYYLIFENDIKDRIEIEYDYRLCPLNYQLGMKYDVLVINDYAVRLDYNFGCECEGIYVKGIEGIKDGIIRLSEKYMDKKEFVLDDNIQIYYNNDLDYVGSSEGAAYMSSLNATHLSYNANRANINGYLWINDDKVIAIMVEEYTKTLLVDKVNAKNIRGLSSNVYTNGLYTNITKKDYNNYVYSNGFDRKRYMEEDELDELEEGDLIQYYTLSKDDDEIYYVMKIIKADEAVVGKYTAVSISKDYVKIDGKKYDIHFNVDDLRLGNKVKAYLSDKNEICCIVNLDNSELCLVSKVRQYTNKYCEDNVEMQLLFQDGITSDWIDVDIDNFMQTFNIKDKNEAMSKLLSYLGKALIVQIENNKIIVDELPREYQINDFSYGNKHITISYNDGTNNFITSITEETLAYTVYLSNSMECKIKPINLNEREIEIKKALYINSNHFDDVVLIYDYTFCEKNFVFVCDRAELDPDLDYEYVYDIIERDGTINECYSDIKLEVNKAYELEFKDDVIIDVIDDSYYLNNISCFGYENNYNFETYLIDSDLDVYTTNNYIINDEDDLLYIRYDKENNDYKLSSKFNEFDYDNYCIDKTEANHASLIKSLILYKDDKGQEYLLGIVYYDKYDSSMIVTDDLTSYGIIAGVSNNVKWKIVDHTLYITGEGNFIGAQDSFIPWYDYAHLIYKVNVDGFRDGTLTNMSYMFRGLENVESIKFNDDINTSNVTNMSSMFYGCSSLTNLDLSNFDTSNVIDMSCMFYNCRSLTNLDLSNFDTSNVINMSGMFDWCFSLTSLDVSNFDTSELTDMSGMFGNCSSLTNLDVSNFNTSNVIYMSSMFYNCNSLICLDLSNFDTSNVIYMSRMFYNCNSLICLDLSNFDTSKTIDMGGMFENCRSLTSIDVSKFTIGKFTDISYIFKNCSAEIVGKNVFDFIYDEHMTNNVKWKIENGTLYITGEGDWEKNENCNTPWYYYRNQILEVIVDGFRDGTLTNMSYMFRGLENVESIKFNDDINTSNVTNMSYMFCGCSSLTNLDLSSFNTSNVTNMFYMFGYCTNLTNLDLSNFDTSNVTDMGYMFSDCTNLTSIDLNNFDTSNVINMSGMFDWCFSLTSLDISSFNTSNVRDMSFMFGACESLTSLDVSNFDTSELTDMSGMFGNCSSLTNLDVSNFDTSNVTSMGEIFFNCSSLTDLDVSNFNTSNVTNMSSMFYNCNSLICLDLSNFDTSKTIDMGGMFENCRSLTSLNVSNFKPSKTIVMSDIFDNCTSLTNLYVLDEKLNEFSEQGIDFNIHFCQLNDQGEIECISHMDCIPSTNAEVKSHNKHLGNNQIGQTSDTNNVQIEIDVLPEISSNETFTMEITINNVLPQQQVVTELEKAKKYNDIDYIDLSLYKVDKTTEDSEAVHDWGALTNNNYINIFIPLTTDKLNRTGYAVHRYHDGVVEELKQNPIDNEEGFFIDEKTGIIKLKVNKFSIYTIEYGTVKQNNPTPSGGGGGGGTSGGGSAVSNPTSNNKQIILHLDSPKINIFGEEKENDVMPIVRDNRTMLPIRIIAESLGATVNWSKQNPTIVEIIKGDTKIIIELGSNIAKVNDKEYELDVVAFAENNRTYLPIRFVSENLNAIVEWNEDKPMEVKIYER